MGERNPDSPGDHGATGKQQCHCHHPEKEAVLILREPTIFAPEKPSAHADDRGTSHGGPKHEDADELYERQVLHLLNIDTARWFSQGSEGAEARGCPANVHSGLSGIFERNPFQG